MFGTTYLCEQVFSVMNLNKTKHRSRLTNTHLNDIVKCAATQDLTPDIDALVKAKKCQVSGASSSKWTAVEKKKVNQQVGLGIILVMLFQKCLHSDEYRSLKIRFTQVSC